jgi:hypothetical protein
MRRSISINRYRTTSPQVDLPKIDFDQPLSNNESTGRFAQLRHESTTVRCRVNRHGPAPGSVTSTGPILLLENGLEVGLMSAATGAQSMAVEMGRHGHDESTGHVHAAVTRRSEPAQTLSNLAKSHGRKMRPEVSSCGYLRRKNANPSTYQPHAGSRRISTFTNSTAHGSLGESVGAGLLASSLAAMSSRVKLGWRPSGSLGPFLNPRAGSDSGDPATLVHLEV